MLIDEAKVFLEKEFPQNSSIVEEIGIGLSVMRQSIDERHLRPGGTVSGPTMMTIADCAAYVAILGQYGKVALAVTTSLNINFLRKPAADKDILAKCKILKSGKRLVVCEIVIFSEGLEDAVAHVTATYSIPPDYRRDHVE